MERYLELLRGGGADLAVEIAAESVVTAAWTVYKCQFGCGHYGKNRCCPPLAPDWRQTQAMIDCFARGILFRTRSLALVTPLAVETARVLFLDGYYRTIAFGAGPCGLCKTCGAERCNFPGRTAPAMEACGIDVFATVRANGIPIATLRERGEVPSCFGLLLVE